MTALEGEIRISAAVVRDEQGRTLLVRKSGTVVFMQPGGKIELGEAASQALVREVREELGTNLISSEYVGTYSAPAANETGCIVVAEVFAAVLDAAPIPAAEIAEIVWFDPHRPPDIEIAPLSRLLLQDLTGSF